MNSRNRIPLWMLKLNKVRSPTITEHFNVYYAMHGRTEGMKVLGYNERVEKIEKKGR